MRMLLVTTLLAGLTLACGGGDEYSETRTTGGQPAAEQPAKAPEKPAEEPVKEIQRMSKMAAALSNAWKLTDKVTNPVEKQKRALEEAEKYAAQGVVGDALFHLGRLYKMGGEPAKAAEAFLSFAASCPTDTNHKWGLYYAAENLAASGEAEQAEKVLTEFATKYETEVKYLKLLAGKVGEGLLLEGKLEAAARMFDRAVAAGSEYAGESLIGVLWALGKFDEARMKANYLVGEFEGKPKLAQRYQRIAARAAKIGKPAPELDVEGWTGNEAFDLSTIKGNVCLVYFWTMGKWNTSKRAGAFFLKLFERYKGENLRVIGLSKHVEFDPVKGEKVPGMPTDDEVRALDAWQHTFSLPWPLGLCADDRNHDAFGYAKVVPTMVLIDKAGRYRYYIQGEGAGKANYEILAKVIERLLDE